MEFNSEISTSNNAILIVFDNNIPHYTNLEKIKEYNFF